MQIHPLAKIFPLIEGEEFDLLAADIKAKGLLEPIWTYEGKILDGRNRWLACKRAGTAPRFQEYKGHDPISFIVSMNLARRHLTPSQRACIGVKILPQYEAEAKDRMLSGKPSGKNTVGSESRQAAAAVVHVAPRYISDAKTIQDEAPELFDAMVGGSLTMQDAKQELQKQHTKKRVAEQVKKYKKADTTSTVLCLDLLKATPEKLGISAGEVDAIITDPPYPKEFLSLFGSLAKFAGDVLCEGGSLIVMSGELHLPEVFQLLTSDSRLTYQWTMAYMTPGVATQIQGKPVGSNWKPLIWLTKGSYHGPRVRDVFENPAPDKEHHEWGQGEVGMTQIIERMTTPGALVIDPFLGGGTTGVCCVRTKRRFVGFDIDKETVLSARARIAKAEDDTKKNR
jgi:16S rRNA G966 N2-methylase RsmD